MSATKVASGVIEAVGEEMNMDRLRLANEIMQVVNLSDCSQAQRNEVRRKLELMCRKQ